MKYSLVHVDTCLSDYWGGHPLHHVSIPVDGATTVKEVYDQIRSELNQGAIAGSFDWETVELEEFHIACMKAVQELEQSNTDILNKAAFPYLEPFDDSGESVMAFFVFVPEEEEE